MRKLLGSSALVAALMLSTASAYAQGTPQNVTVTKVESTTLRNAFRASDVIGSTVENDRNENIGKIDDILVQNADRTLYAVVSVGGFLGIGEKHVLIPYEQLKMGANSAGQFDRDKVVLPGGSKDALKNLPAFTYAHR